MASVGTMKFYYMSPDLIYGSGYETRPNCVRVRACVRAGVLACMCGHERAIMSEQNTTL